jgi:hypothetical protein
MQRPWQGLGRKDQKPSSALRPTAIPELFRILKFNKYQRENGK